MFCGKGEKDRSFVDILKEQIEEKDPSACEEGRKQSFGDRGSLMSPSKNEDRRGVETTDKS